MATDLAQSENDLRRATQALRDGGLVVFPTETVYGIGASAVHPQAIEALRRFKQRPAGFPFTLHVGSPDDISRWADVDGPVVRRLIRKLLPGPVNLVLDVSDDRRAESLSQAGLSPGSEGLIYDRGTLSVRCPDHPLAQRVLSEAGVPVMAGSAGRPGEPPAVTAQHAMDATRGVGEVVVDGGQCRYGTPSTIIRVRQTDKGQTIAVEREGVYDHAYVQKVLRRTILLVCSGNTCRSPMAQGLARQILARQTGLKESELESAGWRIESAGLYAAPGAPASAEAVEALGRQDLDIRGHRARMLTPAMIREADVIYGMTRAHVQGVLTMDPSAASKVFPLDADGDIEDPFGADVTIYEQCAATIRRGLEQRLKEFEP
ncbi:MAG: threonylcarbamoyl-AMP synthase [Phycisphaeraceae bacterium]|nr:threonylcarbamoyl-AMP synthase [Phycisphaeraceae bacterium]